MATIVAAAGGGNWNATGTWVGGAVPTAADNVQLTAASGAVTINVAAFCRSLDCAGYTSTLTHAGAVILTIGDGTSGASNIALRLATTMTYTLGNTNSSTITFVGSSATAQTIDLAGKPCAAMSFSSASNAGTWRLMSDYIPPNSSSGSISLSRGTFDTNGYTINAISLSSTGGSARTLTTGSSVINIQSLNITFPASITITPNTAVVNMTRITSTQTLTLPAIDMNGMSFAMTGNGTAIATVGGATVANFSRTATAAVSDMITFTAASAFTVTGTLVLAGNSATNRLLVQSAVVGTPAIINAGAVSLTNVDFADITAAGAAIPFAGTSIGNALGNSNITFTTPVTRYAVNSGNWSSVNMWSSSSGGGSGASVPLCHDTVIMNASSAAGTYVVNVPRCAKDLTCTGFTRTLNFTAGLNVAIYGSVTLGSGMTFNTNGSAWTVFGRSAHTLTFAGKTSSNTLTINSPGGSYSLIDAFNGGTNFSVTNGTFSSNNFNMSVAQQMTFAAASTVNLGTSTVTLSNATAITVFTNSSTTSTTSSADFVISTVSTLTRTFAGGGQTYNSLTYTVAGSTGTLVVTGANTFGTINFSDSTNARTLTLPATVITTVTSAFNVHGSAGKLMTVNSSTSGTAARISKQFGIVGCDFLSVRDSIAQGGAAWYAGANSVNVSGNTGWIFTGLPSAPGRFFAFFD